MPTKAKKKVQKKVTKTNDKEKLPVGRPSKYDPKFCEVVIEYMSQGYSKEACAGAIGITKDTLYNWAKKHKDFSDALALGVMRSQLFWERMAVENTLHTKNGTQINAQVYNLNMKNRFGWSDKTEVKSEVSEKPKKSFSFDLDVKPEELENG
jgi:transposase-like protein